MAQKDKASKEMLAAKLPLLGAVIGKVIQNSDNWASKKVKKTGLCIGLFIKAAKVLLSTNVDADFSEDPRKLITEAGVKLIQELETAIEKDKTMSNLKGKIKEIKRIVEVWSQSKHFF